MSIKYRTSAGTSASNFTDVVVKVGDTLPIGTEVDYDGQTAPAGWQEVEETNLGDVVVDSIRTKNMLDEDSLSFGTISQSDGKTISSSTTVVYAPTYIPVKPNTQYTASYNGSAQITIRLFKYGADKSYIGTETQGASGVTYKTFTTGNNVYYLRLQFNQDFNNDFQLEEGTNATDYRPYQELNNQEVYSTSETKIGTWIDGKPLYRKVAQFIAPTGSASSTSVPALAIANAVVRNYHAVINLSNGYAINENYQESAYSLYSLAINISNGNVYFPQHTSITANTQITLTVEYTKTTD